MAEAAEDRNPIVFFDVTLGGTCRFLQVVVWCPSPRAILHYVFFPESSVGLAVAVTVTVTGDMFLRSR